jgi:hypothetical protein
MEKNKLTQNIKTKILNFKSELDAQYLISNGYKAFDKNIRESNDFVKNWNVKDDRLYLDINHWEADLYAQKEYILDNREKIVILGESVAQCYGWSPDFSMSKLLQENHPNFQVIDLTRISAPFTSMIFYENIVNQINPAKIIIFAGNNFVNFNPNIPHIFKEGTTLSQIEELIGKYFTNNIVESFIDRLRSWKHFKKVHFIIPMANARAFTPLYSFARNDDELNKINECLTNKNIKTTETVLSQNILCPLLYHHLGSLYEEAGDIKKAYQYYDIGFFLHIDKKNTLPGMNYIYRKSFKNYLNKNNYSHTALEDLFEDDYTKYFSDYCHLNQQGIDKVTQEYSTKILKNTAYKTIKLNTDTIKKIESLFNFINLRNESYKLIKHDNFSYKNINLLNIFNNQPLFLNKTYHQLLEIENYKPILSHLDYKRITPCIVQNNNLPKSLNEIIETKKNNDVSINLLNPNYSFFLSRRKNIPDYKTNFSKSVFGPSMKYTFPKYYEKAKVNIIVRNSLNAQKLIININNQEHIVHSKDHYFIFNTNITLQENNVITYQLKEFEFNPKLTDISSIGYKDSNSFQRKYFEILKMDLMNE